MRLRLDLGVDPPATFSDRHRNHVGDGAVLIENYGSPALFEFHRLWIVYFLHPGKFGIVLQHTSERNAAMHFAIWGRPEGLSHRTKADEEKSRMATS